MIYNLINLATIENGFLKDNFVPEVIRDSLAENFAYSEKLTGKVTPTEIFVRTPILGARKKNEIYSPVKFIVFDLDYDAYKFFDALFSKYSHKFPTFKFGNENYRPVKSANFYALEINSKNAKDVEWFLSRFLIDISPDAKEIIDIEARNFERSQEEVRNITNGKIKLDKGELCTELTVGPNMEERAFQQEFLTLLKHKKRLLNADCMAGGKSFQAAMVALLPDSLPALVVVPKQIDIQWYQELTQKYFTNAKAQIIPSGNFAPKLKNDTHFFIVSYSLLSKVSEMFKSRQIQIKSLIGDEIEQIRNLDTDKSRAFEAISDQVNYCIGLSGTPIGKEGFNLWSILRRINSNNSLGSEQLFREQFCDYENNAKNPQELREYLIKNGDMVSRTQEQVGLGGIKKVVKTIPIHGSLADLAKNNDILTNLAMSVLSLDKSTDSSMSEFDFKLREATGIAKARSVAQMAKIYIEAGRKVIITGWFREFWNILEEELKKYKPVFITGSEIGGQKNQSKEKFINDDSVKVLFLSHLSGAGIDGLQKVCYTLMHGEYAWLVKDHEQLDFRLVRSGQDQLVEIIYPHIDDGSDPFIKRLHERQRIQLNGIMGGKAIVYDEETESEGCDDLKSYDEEKRELLKDVARSILKSKNIEIEEKVKFSETHSRISKVLRGVKVSTKDEKFLQEQLFEIFKTALPDLQIEREVKISKRSILDFRVKTKDGSESIVIECKTTDRGKKSAYKQVERYIGELNHQSTIIFAPWFGVEDFYIGNHQVEILDYSKKT